VARTTGAPVGGRVGGAAAGPSTGSMPAPPAAPRARRHARRPHRDARREPARARGPRWHARDRSLRALGPQPLGHRRAGRRARDHRRLRTHGNRTGGRSAVRGQQPRQHAAHGARPPDGVDPRRHPRARTRRGLRARARAPVGRGRHTARVREPVRDRPQPAKGTNLMSVPRRYGVTVPLGGLPRHEPTPGYEALVALGYTDRWSAEAGGHEGLVPLTLAAAWTPTLRLGTAILPVYTRGAATLAEATASMCQAAPGRFALGI